MKYQTIITVANLANFINTSDCLILDCRGGVLYDAKKHEIFLKSHIPTAFYFCYSTDSLTKSDDTTDSCSCIKASNESQVIESLECHGFEKKSQIIIYDDETSSDFTSSVWLFLRSIGYQNVAVLQGGYPSWEEQEMPVTRNNDAMIKSRPPSNDKTAHLH